MLQALTADIIPLPLLRSLWALSFGRQVYVRITAASISLRIIEQPLHEYSRIPYGDQAPEGKSDKHGKHPSRSQAFACIATLESGGFRIDPKEMTSVMAISSRNSIFVAGAPLSDPTQRTNAVDIRRVVGNVGQPGINLMVSPQKLLVKPPSRDFRAVMHADYDYKRIDSFSGTSLHLLFMKWKLPLSGGDYGLIDQDIFMAEAVISFRDSGRWVADIDILATQPENRALRAECNCGQSNSSFKGRFSSIDSWEEILDPPLTFGIVRAHENWAARLAALCVLKQKNMVSRAGVVDAKGHCLTCLESKWWANERVAAFFID